MCAIIYSIFYQGSSLSRKYNTAFSIGRKHGQGRHICGSTSWPEAPKSLLQLHRSFRRKYGWNISFYLYTWKLNNVWIMDILSGELYFRSFIICFTSSLPFKSCSCVAIAKMREMLVSNKSVLLDIGKLYTEAYKQSLCLKLSLANIHEVLYSSFFCEINGCSCRSYVLIL